MKTIMLVDDSATIRNIINSSLVGSYNTIEAENGKDALDKSLETDVDLFLLDVNMPVMNGIELVRKLRESEKYKKTPIIMLTTESRDNKKNEGKEAGATGWIVKPVDTEKLLGILSKML